MKQMPWTITATAPDQLEILLYDMIGEDWVGEGTSAKSFAQDLKDAGKVSKIHLRVNSPGGNVFDGIAIYNSLLTHGAKVTAQVDGVAASIAGVILMAASEIAMAENGMIMIHNPHTLIAGDANDMRKMADTMDKVKANMINAYRRHTVLSADEVGEMMDAETWMTAQEACDNGFADRVLDPEESDEGSADVAANFDLSHFRKVPRQIAARCTRVDESEQRRRKIRLRTLELHQFDLDAMRRETMARREIEVASMRAADTAISDDLRRRLKMAARERELRAWRAADFVWEDCYIGGFRTQRLVEAVDRSCERRRLLAQREIELGRRKMPTFVVRAQL
ncbi:MAG TPA: head maturation protease, ClpP-related [Verrucomicrobiae bacterium]|nr:head maturation protease, ClpP-related [Verrucomicrobiae bacterium]